MKIRNWLISMVMVFSAHSQAAPITMLVMGDPVIRVGEQFSVEVRLDNDVLDEALLAFGFDVQPAGPLLSYSGFAMGPGFDDVSFGANNAAGMAFPGVTGTDILLATLLFNAESEGATQISVAGLFDGAFSGLFYEFSGFDISAQSSLTIAPRAQSVPGPVGMYAFVLMTLVVLYLRKRNCLQSMRH